MKEIILTPEEMILGANIGCNRLVDSLNKSLDTVSTGAKRNWSHEVEGCLAEIAVAKEFDLYFDPSLGKYRSKDVGKYHVRHTENEKGCLIIRPKDPDGIYILVIGKLGRYKIIGGIDSKKARKMVQYIRDYNGRPDAWFIPQNELQEIGAG